jgi:hypothetical protein
MPTTLLRIPVVSMERSFWLEGASDRLAVRLAASRGVAWGHDLTGRSNFPETVASRTRPPAHRSWLGERRAFAIRRHDRRTVLPSSALTVAETTRPAAAAVSSTPRPRSRRQRWRNDVCRRRRHVGPDTRRALPTLYIPGATTLRARVKSAPACAPELFALCA